MMWNEQGPPRTAKGLVWQPLFPPQKSQPQQWALRPVSTARPLDSVPLECTHLLPKH